MKQRGKGEKGKRRRAEKPLCFPSAPFLLFSFSSEICRAGVLARIVDF
jgi:hypothetical protein